MCEQDIKIPNNFIVWTSNPRIKLLRIQICVNRHFSPKKKKCWNCTIKILDKNKLGHAALVTHHARCTQVLNRLRTPTPSTNSYYASPLFILHPFSFPEITGNKRKIQCFKIPPTKATASQILQWKGGAPKSKPKKK